MKRFYPLLLTLIWATVIILVCMSLLPATA